MTIQKRLASLLALTLLISTAFVAAGCRGKRATTVQNDEGEPAAKLPVVSALKMNDPAAPAQIVKGISALENNSWRWTGGNFSFVLKTPPGAAQKGGTVSLTLVVSEAVLKQVHSQTLTAAIGDKTLGTQKFTEAGNYTFAADVPAAALTTDTVTVDFSLDNSLAPSASDRRELGVIATAVALESK